MSGHWVTIYKNTAQTEVSGYLYCCNSCNNVIRVQEKTDKTVCPKCNEVVVEVN